MRALVLGLALSLALLAMGCACEGPRTATQVVVVIDADDVVRGRATSLRLEVFGDPAQPAPAFPETTRDDTTYPTDAWPRIVALAPENRDPTRIYRVVATASDGTSTVAVARVISGYVGGEIRTVRLYLSARCAPEECDPTETCDALSAECIDAHVDPEDLDPYSPDAGPSMDAGTGDSAVDPCPGGCDDGVPCTVDVCTASGCTNTADDVACDDGEVCTTDTCDPEDGCANAPSVGVACDDGVYCNGTDRCGTAGTCSESAGDPCAGTTLTCDEGEMGCEGVCAGDGDCPADTFGAWSTCDYADGCDQSATRIRTRHSWTCTGSACVEDVTTESEPCTRSTDGDACGSGGCTGYGACDYADVCDTMAMQSRTCTDLLCGGGVCGSVFRTETQGCNRVTTGMPCGSTCMGTCNASGSCSASCGMDAGFDAGRDAGFDAGFDAGRDAPDASDAPDAPDAPVIAADSGTGGVLDAF